MAAISTRLLFVLALVLSSILSAAQQSILERTITITLNNEPIESALKTISRAGGFNFSYASNVINAQEKVSVKVENTSVRQTLDLIFQGRISYRERTRHLVLVRTPEKKNERIVTGYVTDEKSGVPLAGVSVYDPAKLASTISNSYGYFEIKVDPSVTRLKLAATRDLQADTVIAIPRNRRLLNIRLKFDKQRIASRADTLALRIKRFFKSNQLFAKNPNITNIEDTLHRDFQFSFVPFVGTNRQLSANVINKYSLNLLGGYSKGTTRAELAGGFNIIREDAQGFEGAGLFNLIGGHSNGVQAAGIFNASLDGSRSVQLAGITNINAGNANGVAISGVMNFTMGNSSAVFVSGLGNFTVGQQHGVHVGGVFNLATRSSTGVQIAGLLNFTARAHSGVQAASLVNFTGKDHKGIQLSGFANFVGKKLVGAQIAPLNFASRVRGTQLGLINIADSVRGLPLGLLSIVLKGYHKIEFSADEVFLTNIAFRTGVRSFYNILAVGAKPKTLNQDSTFWTFGYGIGTAPRLSRRTSLNLDLTVNHIVDERKVFEKINFLNRLTAGIDLHATRNFSVFLGGTINAWITDRNQQYGNLFDYYKPEVIRELTTDSRRIQFWWGGKIAVRFL